jgi:branched-chain amino acid transport system substrate-binding protein
MDGKIVGKGTYTADQTDFSTLLGKVAESKAEVLYLPDYYNIVNLVGAQAKEKGMTAVLMGGDGWDSSELDVKAANGGFYSNHYDPNDTRPVVQSWVKTYGEAYRDDNGNPKIPNAIAALTYDATNLLLASIQKAGVDDPDKVKDAMAAITWEGVTGKINFNALHNPLKNVVVIGIKDGKKEFVTSVAP